MELRLTESGFRIEDEDEAADTHSRNYCGVLTSKGILKLSYCEGFHLICKDSLETVIVSGKENLTREECRTKVSGYEPEFEKKFPVYQDLRDRGLVIKTGFKYGAHFRTYKRGVNPYKDNPKSNREHTDRLVHCVNESDKLNLEDVSQRVRLGENVRAETVMAVVDSENGITYYNIDRITP